MSDPGDRDKWEASWAGLATADHEHWSLARKRYVWPFEGFVTNTARLYRRGEVALEQTRVLDFGCGHGRHAQFFARSGFRHVAGVDLSAEAVDVARAWAASERLPIDFRSYDGATLPWSDGAFDLVSCFGTLHHVPAADLPALAREVARMVRPGGIFLWAELGSRSTRLKAGTRIARRTFTIEDPADPEFGIPQHYFTLAECRALFPDFDFEVGSYESLEGEGLDSALAFWNLLGRKRR